MTESGSFSRSSNGGPGWSYEPGDRYSLSFVTEMAVPVSGWFALASKGEPVIYVKDGALATSLKDILNRAEQLTRVTA